MILMDAALQNEPIFRAQNEPIFRAQNEAISRVQNEPIYGAQNEPILEPRNEPIADPDPPAPGWPVRAGGGGARMIGMRGESLIPITATGP